MVACDPVSSVALGMFVVLSAMGTVEGKRIPVPLRNHCAYIMSRSCPDGQSSGVDQAIRECIPSQISTSSLVSDMLARTSSLYTYSSSCFELMETLLVCPQYRRLSLLFTPQDSVTALAGGIYRVS
jgi:hypothetical protein